MAARNDGIAHDTEDKGWWCLHGERLEHAFIEVCNQHLSLDARINPDKAANRYVPDLVVDGRLSDLKVQNTPFFLSSRYDLDPGRCVTFNRKDYERYRRLYPGIDIYYWVEWTQTTSRFGRVPYLAGIYRLAFQRLAALIEAGAPEHRYVHREGDSKGNAKSSFVLRLDDFEILMEKTGSGRLETTSICANN